MAGGAGVLALIVAGAAALAQRKPLSATAAAAVAIAGIALVLGLEGLLHPGKPYVDAMFHAHKLDDVLAGHYFFTQPMPSGVEFPYAIGLYVTAAPWASLTRDHVLLLRVVVATAHVLAALSLYPLVQSRWRRPGAAVVAVAALSAGPLPFIVIGNANQTYAFGQSVATMAPGIGDDVALRLAAAGRARRAPGARRAPDVGTAFHVGLFPLLGGLVGASAVLVAWRGAGGDRLAGWLDPRRDADRDDPRGRALLPSLRRRVPLGAARRPGQQLAAAPAPAPAPSPDMPPSEATAATRPAPVGTSRPQRAGRAAGLAVAAYGAPLLVLALAGLSGYCRSATGGIARRSMILASVIVCALVAGVSVVAPVEPRFERYTDEFISRLYYAVTPAVAILAASGASWLWTRGWPGRGAAAAGLLAAVLVAGRMWLGWIQ